MTTFGQDFLNQIVARTTVDGVSFFSIGGLLANFFYLAIGYVVGFVVFRALITKKCVAAGLDYKLLSPKAKIKELKG